MRKSPSRENMIILWRTNNCEFLGLYSLFSNFLQSNQHVILNVIVAANDPVSDRLQNNKLLHITFLNSM